MVIPEHQSGKTDDSLIAFQKVGEVVENTRQAGGQQQTDSAIVPQIIVDMREFRSDLPCLIHRRGIEVVPVTITVNCHHSLFLSSSIKVFFFFFLFSDRGLHPNTRHMCRKKIHF